MIHICVRWQGHSEVPRAQCTDQASCFDTVGVELHARSDVLAGHGGPALRSPRPCRGCAGWAAGRLVTDLNMDYYDVTVVRYMSWQCPNAPQVESSQLYCALATRHVPLNAAFPSLATSASARNMFPGFLGVQI